MIDIDSRHRLALAAFGAAWLLCPAGFSAQASSAPAVTVATVVDQNVAAKVEFIGRLEVIQAVDIRARVTGVLMPVAFPEGQDVAAGAPLFAIERGQYEAAVEQAQAQIASANATLRNAELNLERRQELFARNAASQADVDAAQANHDTAKAALTTAQAQARLAQINLDYTAIAAPLSGRIGKAAVTQGNIVGPQSGVLARIVQLNPIRTVFSVAERDVIAIREEFKGKTEELIRSAFLPTLRLANGQLYDSPGVLEFVGNEVDPATGTVPVRVRFNNPNALLLPGGTVFVSLRPSAARVLPVVPMAAVLATSKGKQVLVVAGDDKVEARPITATTQVGQGWAVESGLKAGETIIVDGLQKVRPGMTVAPIRAAQPAGKP